MKKNLLLLTVILSLFFNSCVEECEGECDILDDGTIECPCDDNF